MSTDHIPELIEKLGHFEGRLALIEHRLQTIEESSARRAKKLDDLVDTFNHGRGAFWLAGVLLTTGVVGFVVTLIDKLRRLME